MDPIRSMFAAACREAIALVLPVQCVGCGAPDAAVCERCAALMTGPVLSRELEPGFPVWAGTSYTGVARRALLALKNEQRTDAAGGLALVLEAAVGAAVADLADQVLDGGPLTLASLPSTRAAYRRRGYRPVDVVVARTGFALARPLAWRRQPADQIGLRAVERAANLAGSLRALRSATGRSFLLVDDVITTGETLREARRALAEAGATVPGAAVIAATPLRILPVS